MKHSASHSPKLNLLEHRFPNFFGLPPPFSEKKKLRNPPGNIHSLSEQDKFVYFYLFIYMSTYIIRVKMKGNILTLSSTPLGTRLIPAAPEPPLL